MVQCQTEKMVQEPESAQTKLQQFTSYVTNGHIRGDTDATFLTISRSALVELFGFLLERVRFDEEYYRRSNQQLPFWRGKKWPNHLTPCPLYGARLLREPSAVSR